MAALTKKRAIKPVRATSIELVGTVQQVYQGGVACFDTSTGLVAKAAVSTTMLPIGTFAEDKNVASGQKVAVSLFDELHAMWMANSTAGDEIVAADVGKLCYFVDDQTVAKTDATNTRSVAGRVWAIDATKGVLVNFRNAEENTNSGLDV